MKVTIHLTTPELELLCNAIVNEAVRQTNHKACTQLSELLGNIRIQSELTEHEKRTLCISNN